MENVHCTELTKNQIKILCQKCSVFYRKDGLPRKYPKLKYHYHGNNGKFNNRIEGRISHCKFYEHYDIVIDDTTLKII